MTASAADGADVLPDRGHLADWPLPRVLLALHERRFDGRLVLGSGRHEKRFTFEGGAPVLAESGLASEALGSQLVDQGKLERADYQRVCGYVEQKGCREGVALLALQLIGPKDLFAALKAQVRRRMVDCFGWPDGEFRIEPGDARGEDAQAFRCDPVSLTQEGLETHWSVERMVADLTPMLERFPVASKRLARVVGRLRLDDQHAGRLGTLDGRTPLGVALGPLFGTPRAAAGVWIADALGCLEYRDAPAGDHEPRFDSAIEISLTGEATSSAAGAAPAASAGAAKPAAGSSNAEGDALRAQIEKLLGSLDDLDHYAVLGVPHDARAGAIKKAYFKAAKVYHPDSLARLGLEDVRGEASDVFARIAEAFEVLSDPERRKDYDAELRGEITEKDATRLAQAETSYRKGEVLLRMGDFAGALEYLLPAADLWPDEPVYRSALGWALFKQPASDAEAARTQLTQAVRLAPEDATAHLRLGMVLRALGRDAEADEVVAAAKRLNADVA